MDLAVTLECEQCFHALVGRIVGVGFANDLRILVRPCPICRPPLPDEPLSPSFDEER